MNFLKIIKPETHKYWWIQGQVVTSYESRYLFKILAPHFSHIDTIYYEESQNCDGSLIVNFYVDKNQYDCYGNPLSNYVKEQLKELEEYRKLGTVNDMKMLLKNVNNCIDKFSHLENK